MDLYDVAVARKLSSGGGGGSSDFSTAEVTIINNSGGSVQCAIPFVLVDNNMIYTQMQLATGFEHTTIIPLYKSTTRICLFSKGIEVSGNITDIDGIVFEVTGDCTITIS